MLEKCFDVMSYPKERKVRLDTFLLQKEPERWWKFIFARHNNAHTLDKQTFRGVFKDKYYPCIYYDAKRDKFLGLRQGSLSVAKYNRKYIELLRYDGVIVASESDRCRRFKRGLRFEIRQTSIASVVRQAPCASYGSNHQGTRELSPKQLSSRKFQQLQKRAPTVQDREELLKDLGNRERMLELLSEGLAIYNLVGDVLLVNEVLRNCERKIVPLSLISILKAEKLLRKGCTTFIAHVIEVQEEKLKPKDVPIVIKFLDVFLTDLSGLLPDREMKFKIELLPGITPFLQTLYRIASSELKELKVMFLGHVVSADEVSVDKQKLEVIVNWEKPVKATKSFQEQKKRLVVAPILTLPEGKVIVCASR
ncbi:Retrotransposon protein [Cucumis melo var. makuwa]|uniref:Retrotransposon protein n=1 Tax=Cucumis melo var. makuwa TaxID=1194695 RepID=A0A5A7UJ83_CUCMM|nr:Retrotransposon protein [Cucumis melo var. makuwa]TYK19126.1 Retrotransposon protein [Cucumis melo var. makuwa]